MGWKCSRCGKELTDFTVKITTTFEVLKISDENIMIPFNNVSDPTSEHLCADCFDEYANVINTLNKINNGLSRVNPTEAVDLVQYGFNKEGSAVSKIVVEEDVEYGNN